MLFPRYSLRLILLFIAGCAVVFLCARYWLSGQAWAGAIMASVLAIVFVLLVQVLAFLALWCLSLLISALRPEPAEATPFRPDTPDFGPARRVTAVANAPAESPKPNHAGDSRAKDSDANAPLET